MSFRAFSSLSRPLHSLARSPSLLLQSQQERAEPCHTVTLLPPLLRPSSTVKGPVITGGSRGDPGQASYFNLTRLAVLIPCPLIPFAM